MVVKLYNDCSFETKLTAAFELVKDPPKVMLPFTALVLFSEMP
jgi:hypothetical protein